MYLSWSIYQLAAALLVFLCSFCYTIYRYKKTKDKKELKINYISLAVYIFVVLFLAFNVGLKQENINRSKFNQQVGEAVEKKESDRKTVEDVKQEFIKSIKDN